MPKHYLKMLGRSLKAKSKGRDKLLEAKSLQSLLFLGILIRTFRFYIKKLRNFPRGRMHNGGCYIQSFTVLCTNWIQSRVIATLLYIQLTNFLIKNIII